MTYFSMSCKVILYTNDYMYSAVKKNWGHQTTTKAAGGSWTVFECP